MPARWGLGTCLPTPVKLLMAGSEAAAQAILITLHYIRQILKFEEIENARLRILINF